MLAAHGEFYPFALAVTVDDRIVAPSVDPGSDHPPAEQVLRLLVTALARNRADLRAAAVCADVKVPGEDGPRDALRVELEAVDGDCLTLVVPYTQGPVFGEPSGQAGERRIWPAQQYPDRSGPGPA
ncbi:MAG: hypothetical protein JWN57_538 [Frankiales bacterium]|jgi:hypothetical protein|nr:hypothetical protein [Frankiales bacterium]